MLGSKNRLTASSDIERVVRSGRRVKTKALTIYVAPSSHGTVRIACVAGKKVHKHAVVRHAVQRKLRAASRGCITSFQGSYDIVIVALTPAVSTMSIQEIAQEITRALPAL